MEGLERLRFDAVGHIKWKESNVLYRHKESGTRYRLLFAGVNMKEDRLWIDAVVYYYEHNPMMLFCCSEEEFIDNHERVESEETIGDTIESGSGEE